MGNVLAVGVLLFMILLSRSNSCVSHTQLFHLWWMQFPSAKKQASFCVVNAIARVCDIEQNYNSYLRQMKEWVNSDWKENFKNIRTLLEQTKEDLSNPASYIIQWQPDMLGTYTSRAWMQQPPALLPPAPFNWYSETVPSLDAAIRANGHW